MEACDSTSRADDNSHVGDDDSDDTPAYDVSLPAQHAYLDNLAEGLVPQHDDPRGHVPQGPSQGAEDTCAWLDCIMGGQDVVRPLLVLPLTRVVVVPGETVAISLDVERYRAVHTEPAFGLVHVDVDGRMERVGCVCQTRSVRRGAGQAVMLCQAVARFAWVLHEEPEPGESPRSAHSRVTSPTQVRAWVSHRRRHRVVGSDGRRLRRGVHPDVGREGVHEDQARDATTDDNDDDNNDDDDDNNDVSEEVGAVVRQPLPRCLRAWVCCWGRDSGRGYRGPRHRVALTRLPTWLCGRVLDEHTLVRRATYYWSIGDVSHKAGAMRGAPLHDPEAFSYWLTRCMPIGPSQRQALLEIRSTTVRLTRLVQLARSMNDIFCLSCSATLANRSAIASLSEEGPGSSYVNRHGFIHQIITLSRVEPESLALVGEPSSQDTWFPGFSWIIAHCSSCFNHIGWMFVCDDPNGHPTHFYGLVRTGVTIGHMDEESSS